MSTNAGGRLLKDLGNNLNVGHLKILDTFKELFSIYSEKNGDGDKNNVITYAANTVKKYIAYEKQNKDNYSKVDFENYFGPINEGIATHKGRVRRKLFL